MKHFVNVSNHPISKWSESQLKAAKELCGGGELIDFPFPQVDPNLEGDQLCKLAEKVAREVCALVPEQCACIHIMGETSMVFQLMLLLMKKGHNIYVSTTERKAIEEVKPDGSVAKYSIFNFTRFRQILLPFPMF